MDKTLEETAQPGEDPEESEMVEPVVNVFEYLTQAGFDSRTSAEITIAAIIQYSYLPVDAIARAAEELGYWVPTSFTKES